VALLVKELAAATPLDRLPLVCLSAPLGTSDQDASHRSLQPTRRTNTFEPFELPSAPPGFAFALPCWRRSPRRVVRHLSAHAVATPPTRPKLRRRAVLKGRNPSERLGDARPPLLAILPRVKPRLTAWLQLQSQFATEVPMQMGSCFAVREAPSPRRCRPRAKLAKRFSDALVVFPFVDAARERRLLEETRTAFPTPASTVMDSTAQSAFRLRVPREGLSLIRRLCRRVVSFRLAFTPARSREPGLDPSSTASSSLVMGREATCRSSTSAIKTARKHDRGTVRTLPTPREVAFAWSSLDPTQAPERP
jgi:hypothetical protein